MREGEISRQIEFYVVCRQKSFFGKILASPLILKVNAYFACIVCSTGISVVLFGETA